MMYEYVAKAHNFGFRQETNTTFSSAYIFEKNEIWYRMICVIGKVEEALGIGNQSAEGDYAASLPNDEPQHIDTNYSQC
jgi:hypothetical protein